MRSTHLLVATLIGLPVLASCGSPPVPPPVPRETKVAIAPPSPAPAPLGGGEPARSPSRIEAPPSSCTIDATAPAEKGTAPVVVGIERVYVGAAPLAHMGSLGDIRHVRIVFAEARPGVAYVEVDGADVSVIGAVPLHVGSSSDLVLYPRTRIVRDGWLDYDSLSIAIVGKDTLGPSTDLYEGLVPTAAQPFDVPCAELTPLRSAKPAATEDSEIRGKGIALEDERGKKVATLDANSPANGARGRAAVILATKGARTKVRFEAGPRVHAEGWVASRYVRKVGFVAGGYGSGSGHAPKLDTLTCDRDVPLWADVRGTIFIVGAVHAHRTVNGKLDAKNDFVVDLGSGAGVSGPVSQKGEPIAPFVPRHELAACGDVGESTKKRTRD